MSEKVNRFIEGLDQLIGGSEAIRDKVDTFQLSDENDGRLLIIEKKKAGIPRKDVRESKLTAISKQLLASALGDMGAFRLQAYQDNRKDYGYLEISATVSRLGLEAIVGGNYVAPLRINTILARGFDGRGIEATLALAATGLLQERPIEKHEDDALALLTLAQDFFRKL